MTGYDESLDQYDDLPLDEPPVNVGNDRENDPKKLAAFEEDEEQPEEEGTG